jgi:hypothetical protein
MMLVASINIAKTKKILFAAMITLSIVLTLAFYFQCYYRQEKLTELYCVVINEYYSEPLKSKKGIMLITENAYGMTENVKRNVILNMSKNDIWFMERAIPPHLIISSEISNKKKLYQKINDLFNRTLYVKVKMQESFFDHGKEIVYEMKYLKGMWKVE